MSKGWMLTIYARSGGHGCLNRTIGVEPEKQDWEAAEHTFGRLRHWNNLAVLPFSYSSRTAIATVQ